MTDEPQGTAAALKSKLDRLGEQVRERDQNAVIRLPLWSEKARGTPNAFLRSALFPAIQSKDRVYLKEKVVVSQKGTVVKFTGEQLNQEDMTVWETLVHLAREHPLGNVCNFTAHGILKAMNMPTGGKNHKELHSSIIRLTACAVQVTHEGKTYFGPLIKSGVKDEITKHYTIELNRELIRLYGETQWTAIDWQQRLDLRRKHLAQALHAYYSSHRSPYPVKLSTLQQLTGSRNKQPASFKRQAKTALDTLVSIGFLSDYTIEGDLVTVRRAPVSFPQQARS